jgi:hypothetical protein
MEFARTVAREFGREMIAKQPYWLVLTPCLIRESSLVLVPSI